MKDRQNGSERVNTGTPDNLAARSVALGAGVEIRRILEDVCDTTGMGFAAVARVTESRWIACQVLDKIAFGLDAGDELQLSTTICDEIRGSGKAVVFDSYIEDPLWRSHPTPVLYGFQSYASFPLMLADGSFFGTLCAIDPEPHSISTASTIAAMEAYAAHVSKLLPSAMSMDTLLID